MYRKVSASAFSAQREVRSGQCPSLSSQFLYHWSGIIIVIEQFVQLVPFAVAMPQGCVLMWTGDIAFHVDVCIYIHSYQEHVAADDSEGLIRKRPWTSNLVIIISVTSFIPQGLNLVYPAIHSDAKPRHTHTAL